MSLKRQNGNAWGDLFIILDKFMQKYKILTLTDHRKHSQENSIYALLATLAAHTQCETIDIASRGNKQNDNFFYNMTSTKVNVRKLDKNFAFDADGKQFFEDLEQKDIADYDAIIMRLPRPISDEFLQFLAEKAAEKVIINHPLGIIKTSSKAFLLNVPECCPPMQICRSVEEIIAFSKKFAIVLKPLREYGGKGIFKIQNGKVYDGNEIYEVLPYLKNIAEQLESEGYLMMKYLKNVTQGDKRILVVGGQIMAASLRLPAKNSWLCNVAQGGTSVSAQIEPEEEAIIKTISPKLEAEGIFIFGADTLVDDDGKRTLSEVNTLSIGGFPQAEKQTGKPIVQKTINKIVKYIDAKKT